MKRILGLVPNIFFLGLVSLFNDFSAEMVLAVMPAFLVSLGAAPAFVGFIEGFADALASILKILSGWFSDRIRRRKVVSVSGYIISVATRAFLPFVSAVGTVFALRAVDRVGKGLRDAPRDALVAESVEQKELGRSFGYQRAMDAVGGVLGPLAAVSLLPLLGGSYPALFWVAFGVGILAILSFAFVREPKIHVSKEPRKLSFSPRGFSPEFRAYLLAVFVFGIGAMPVSLVLLRAEALGSLVYYIPLLYLIYSISFTIFAIPAGRLSDRFGERRVITWGFLFLIASYVTLAAFSSFPLIALGFVGIGVYSAMTNGVQRALASKLVPRDAQATGQGFLGAATGIASLVAGLGGGLIWTFFGATTALFAGAGAMILGVLLFIRLNDAPLGAYNRS